MPLAARLMTVSSAKNARLAEFLDKSGTVVVRKEEALRLAWTCIIAGGHLLVEDLPGMGKTTMVKVIAQLLNMPWKRIQCTNDLLPADISGGNIYDSAKGQFVFHPGPLFSNLVMADELNRASPKSQSAFLQAMEEGFVTIDTATHRLPNPFVIIATQNSQDSIGTNPLPESQVDRFLMSVSLGLPDRDGERQLLMDNGRADRILQLSPVLGLNELIEIRKEVESIHVAERLANYILDIVDYLRERTHGLSPRGALALVSAARAWAWGCQRSFVIPDDIRDVIKPVLVHRLVLKSGAGGDVRDLIDECLRVNQSP